MATKKSAKKPAGSKTTAKKVAKKASRAKAVVKKVVKKAASALAKTAKKTAKKVAKATAKKAGPKAKAAKPAKATKAIKPAAKTPAKKTPTAKPAAAKPAAAKPAAAKSRSNGAAESPPIESDAIDLAKTQEIVRTPKPKRAAKDKNESAEQLGLSEMPTHAPSGAKGKPATERAPAPPPLPKKVEIREDDWPEDEDTGLRRRPQARIERDDLDEEHDYADEEPPFTPDEDPHEPTYPYGGETGAAQTTPRSSHEVQTLLSRGSVHMKNGLYDEALLIFERVLDRNENELYAIYGTAFCLGAIASGLRDPKAQRAAQDRVLALADRLIDATDESSLWPMLEPHKFPRETLRFAYNAKAWYGAERARSMGELETPLTHIDHALSLTSPLDDDRALHPYWDTKVRILLRMGRTAQAYEIVNRFPSAECFADLRATKEYAEWKANGGASELLEGSADESPADALDRLARAIDAHGHETYGALVFGPKIAASEVALAEAELEVKLPPSYVDLVTTRGCFKLLWDKPEEREAEAVAAKFGEYRGCRALLSPSQILEQTLQTRKDYREADDADAAQMLEDSILFQENYYRDNFYVFRSSDGGEMSVHAFYHDDEYIWSNEARDFAAHIRAWVKDVIDDR
jgi:tetratricopeptide (TPR) repeat protein